VNRPLDRIARIQQQLTVALEPLKLEVIDDSHLHAGHAGAEGEKGHYTVQIVSARFNGLRPIARHQLVYQAVAEMMHTEIHALSIIALAPDEAH
jgi:BolA family transcriptional regulator, general stress-responsive regulator